MEITWLGHACFLLEQDGYRIVTDPYEGVDGYPPLRVSAHAVYCSHEHLDHSFRDGVTLLPPRKSPFAVREIDSYHDEERGRLRGSNIIRCFSAGGVEVCHLGDLGHLLSGEQTRKIGRADVLLIPVGGVYTIDPAEARETVRALAPRCAVPMHYRHAPYGLPNLGGVERFAELFCVDTVRTLLGNHFTVSDDLPELLIPTWSRL